MSRKNFVEKVTGQLSELNKLNFVNSFKPSYTVIWVANMFISIIFIHSLTITNNDPRVRNIELSQIIFIFHRISIFHHDTFKNNEFDDPFVI